MVPSRPRLLRYIALCWRQRGGLAPLADAGVLLDQYSDSRSSMSTQRARWEGEPPVKTTQPFEEVSFRSLAGTNVAQCPERGKGIMPAKTHFARGAPVGEMWISKMPKRSLSLCGTDPPAAKPPDTMTRTEALAPFRRRALRSRGSPSSCKTVTWPSYTDGSAAPAMSILRSTRGMVRGPPCKSVSRLGSWPPKTNKKPWLQNTEGDRVRIPRLCWHGTRAQRKLRHWPRLWRPRYRCSASPALLAVPSCGPNSCQAHLFHKSSSPSARATKRPAAATAAASWPCRHWNTALCTSSERSPSRIGILPEPPQPSCSAGRHVYRNPTSST
mmetsp:Transcript_139998/g.447759  ORF Transcript_139998/g.447759 Transcript_139998/m.447759 type:complete len:328 (+) Transcript_139998:738-1721(+)